MKPSFNMYRMRRYIRKIKYMTLLNGQLRSFNRVPCVNTLYIRILLLICKDHLDDVPTMTHYIVMIYVKYKFRKKIKKLPKCVFGDSV